jgi:two-component system, LytTR family, response regulator LytT
MQIAIIEDEPEVALHLQRLLLEINPTIEILNVLTSVPTAIAWLKDNQVDLIMMDINLGKESAFKIFEQINLKTPVIFTTAYEKYSLQAFKVNSIDYLLKPIDKAELAQSLQKFNQLKSNLPPNLIDILKSIQPPSKEYQKRFMVASGEKLVSVKTEDIAYFFGHQRYIFLVTLQNEQYLVDASLEKLEELVNPHDFFRINRQFIVRFEAIKNMYTYLRGRVKLDLNPPCKEEAIVSTERAAEFKQWLNR